MIELEFRIRFFNDWKSDNKLDLLGYECFATR
jgi:hypothetical protein